MLVRIHHDGDDVLIAWKPDGFIPGCRGFALLRRRNGIEEVVSTWVGFADDQAAAGERRASTNWPIQKYQWTDYMTNPGDRVAYRVLPMVGADKANLRPDPDSASDWTDEITLTHEASSNIEAVFNRGVVAAQWVSRRLGVTGHELQNTKLETVIGTPGDPLRDYLAGPLGTRLFALLDAAARDGREVYAALYELDDPQLTAALARLGDHAHVVLANGSVKKKGDDQNAEARDELRGQIELHDRMCSPRALGHNKFLVVCDQDATPRWVWTGSQNWTMTGLCTQANNSLLIEDPDLAEHYRQQWTLLEDAGDATPETLRAHNSEPSDRPVGAARMRLWFTPTHEHVDLEDARPIITGAQTAILFLMFNPGPKDSLLNTILDTARAGRRGERLYIRGVLNQDPSTTANPVHLFDQENTEKADFDVVLPAAIDAPTTFFQEELEKLDRAFAMVHSKVIVVDPFGSNPVVLTGSHNLGPKASGTNDENLLVIRNTPGLADAYATNIMSVYNQYRWRFRRHLQPAAKRWKGLADSDSWQSWHLKPDSPQLREINFWVE
ncbi:phospholipase D-like domain-containing protein [Nocardia miyunensis]|uniref:phospholipase D-like domain-containing protein n=1 Tax=Nocardia miyunensis TaxID=282684 RepID=UPI000829F4C0|nr:phospholipase D-like domain-containing protein [Nocardia miyunensis]